LLRKTSLLHPATV